MTPGDIWHSINKHARHCLFINYGQTTETTVDKSMAFHFGLVRTTFRRAILQLRDLNLKSLSLRDWYWRNLRYRRPSVISTCLQQLHLPATSINQWNSRITMNPEACTCNAKHWDYICAECFDTREILRIQRAFVARKIRSNPDTHSSTIISEYRVCPSSIDPYVVIVDTIVSLRHSIPRHLISK